MTEYEETVELYQAQNAVQIAEAQGAAQYAPDVFKKPARNTRLRGNSSPTAQVRPPS